MLPMAAPLSLSRHLSRNVPIMVFTHMQACGGVTVVYLSSVAYSILAVWVYRDSRKGYSAATCVLVLAVLYLM